MGLAALQGRQVEVPALIEATASDVAMRGEGIAMSVAEWANALLHNGLGRYPEAMRAAQQALHYQEYPGMHYPGIANWAAAELVEASARSGMTGIATDSYRWIAEMTSASGTNWALGVEARSCALVTEGNAAEGLYQDSIMHLARSRVRAELARAHLLYGEWLRRQRRRTDAREQLRTAHGMLEAMGMEAFAERARRELQATGGTARKRTAVTGRDRRADRPGGPDRPAGPRRAVQSRDRCPAIPQSAHGPVPPGQRLRQARDHLAQPSQPRPALADRAIRATTLAEYAAAVLHDGLGCHGSAFTAAQRACEHDDRAYPAGADRACRRLSRRDPRPYDARAPARSG